MVHGVAEGLIRLGRQSLVDNFTVLVLESAAQHFMYDIDWKNKPIKNNASGVFIDFNFPRRKISGPCCKPTLNNDAGNFRNIALLKSLCAIDPHWGDYIGWIPFYDASQMSNGHVDSNKDTPDCTHFMYQPFFYDPLYHAIEAEVIRLRLYKR